MYVRPVVAFGVCGMAISCVLPSSMPGYTRSECVVRLQIAARAAYGTWLGQREWDLFLTLTSGEKDADGVWRGKWTHPEALHKRFRYCVHLISDAVYGRARTRRGSPIEYVNGIERHKTGVPHCHAVLRLPDVDLADRVQFPLAVWQERLTDTGGLARLERPRDQADVVNYATKYVAKDGELILSENLSPSIDPNPSLALGTDQHSGGSAAAVGRSRIALPDHP